MGEIAGFALALGLAMSGMDNPNDEQRDRYMSAAGKSLTAGYIQSGMKKEVDRKLKDIERKYIPKPLAKYGSMTVIILKTLEQKQLTLVWSF